MDLKQISTLENTVIKGINPSSLSDVQDVKICGRTALERLESYVSQVKNPYCFRVGKTPVKVSFASNGEAIEDKLERFFIALRML